MGSVNKVILVGNLGRDAELRYTPGGAAVATLNLATTEVWNDRNNQRQEKTEWHRVVLWGKQAESLQEYLTKGKQIYVEGRLQTRQWDDKDGNKRYTTEIKADRVTLLGGGGGGGGRSGGGGMDRGGSQGRRPTSRRWSRSPTTIFRSDDAVRGDGMRRPPLPPLRSLPSVAILEPHDIVQFGRRHFEHVGVFDRRHPVHGLRRDVHPCRPASSPAW